MTKIKYDFGSGRSDPETFPVAALQAAASKVIEEQAEALTQYPGDLGHAGMRAAMAQREEDREGISIDPNHLLLTNGSMQGVTLTAEALQENHGDTVLVEEYCYPGTLSAYRSLKSRARRLQIIEMAKHYGVPIVEDNCYADVHYDGPLEPAFYALDDDPNQIYLCSLSKILAPGLRLGYIYARPPMLEKILGRRHDAGSNYLAAAIAAEFYQDGIQKHAKATNPVLKAKRDLTLQGLETELGDICVWSEPVGGLFIWVRLPDDVDTKALRPMALEQGVNFLPGQSFHYQRDHVPYLRLAFGHLTLNQISEGLPILARCIQSCRGSNEGRDFDTLFK